HSLPSLRPPPRSALFPYTTLFRSAAQDGSPCAFHTVPSVHAVLGHRQGSERGHGALRQRRARAERDTHGPESDRRRRRAQGPTRSEEHTSELQSRFDLVCRLLLEK